METMMDLAAFSPRKLQLLNHSSPRNSARKRSLFPSGSPQTNDLGLISEIYSDDSNVYSPPLISPASSLTPGKDSGSTPMKGRADQTALSRVKNCLEFESYINSPRRSPRKSFGKEILEENFKSTRKSLTKSSRKTFLDKENFDDHFIPLFSHSPKKKNGSVEFQMSSDNFTTPKKNTSAANKSPRRSPRAFVQEGTIKPNSFYGNVAPMLATNQTNRIQGMKCVFRPVQPPRAKAKLLFEEKPAKKRERSKSMDAVRGAKKRKIIFTGVYHAIPKPGKALSPPVAVEKQSIREKAQKCTDLSRTPYGMKKKKLEGWEYTLRFTKPLRYEDSSNLGSKRKFFKSSVQDSLSSSPGSSSDIVSPLFSKKRKLLDTRKSYLEVRTPPKKPQINPADIAELIDGLDGEKMQDIPEVDDILLRLEEDDEEEKKKEAQRQMLMNILEDSPNKTSAIDSLSNCTASLYLNESPGSSCSRFSLEDAKENQSTPRRMFSIFDGSSTPGRALSDVTNKGSSTKKKWRGVGIDQLQIDAGQSHFGARQCPECGMIYQLGEAEDELQHSYFHNNVSTLRHNSWKNENIVGSFGLDHIIVVTGDDPKSWQQKAMDVIAVIDKSLGITSENTNVMHNQKVFLYISEKRVVGCMVASPVTRAYKMLNSQLDSEIDLCSEESYPVRCGIGRMWTLFSHRRRGIASKLLDTIRRNFMYGCILAKDNIAFSIPTPDGKQFAKKYMGSDNFLVYVGY